MCVFVCVYFYQSLRWIFLSAIGMTEAHSLKFKTFSTCDTSFLYLQCVGLFSKKFAEHLRRQNESRNITEKHYL